MFRWNIIKLTLEVESIIFSMNFIFGFTVFTCGIYYVMYKLKLH